MTGDTELSTSASVSVLRTSKILAGVPDDLLEKLSTLAIRKSYARGSVLFAQDDIGDSFFGIVSGRVRISAMAADGREVHIVDFGPGDTFGEISILDGGPRTASATVVEPSTLFTVSRASFLDLIGSEPDLALRIMERLCERLRETSELVEDFSLLSIEEQIAKRIWLLATSFARNTNGRMELQISQGDLAAFLGLSRQSVNAYLQRLRDEGILDVARGKIQIRDLRLLKAVFDAPRPG